jgi:hypothetical protein
MTESAEKNLCASRSRPRHVPCLRGRWLLYLGRYSTKLGTLLSGWSPCDL